MRGTKVHALLAAVAALFIVLAATAGQDRTPWRLDLTGEFQATVHCYLEQGYSTTVYTLRTEDEREYTLQFPGHETTPEPGSTITISGRLREGIVYVDEFAELESSHQIPTTGEQKFIIALVNFQNDTTQNVTASQVQARFFSPTYSADQYWREASFGKTWATGDVVGWLTLPMDRACNSNQVRNLTITALDNLGINLPQYNRLVILIPGAGGCSWAGLGTLGASTFQTSNGPWRTTVSWCRSEYYNNNLHPQRSAVFLTAHEVGHNFGRNHSRSSTFGSAALGQFDCSSCGSMVSEYGDQFCSVGGGWRPGHYNARHKVGLNWFDPEHVQTVTRSGVYALDVYSTNTNQTKTLKVHRGFGPSTGINEYLYLEWRQPIGYDSEINWMGGINYDGILVHYDFSHPQTATFILDMTPGDGELRNAALRTGQTWQDIHTRVGIKPLGVSGGKMLVDVKVGDPVLPIAYDIVRGAHVSGGLTDLFESDDQYLSVRPGPVLSSTEPFMQLVFTGQIAQIPQALRFEFEANTSAAIRQRIELFNYTTNTWQLADNRDSTTSDSYVETNVWQNTSRFIHPTTGEMQARVSWFHDRPVLAFPVIASMDQAVWKILR